MNKMSKAKDKKTFFKAGRFTAAFMISALLLVSLAGCSGTNVEAEVASTAINQSPENTARVFAKATFSGDKDLLLACFPPDYTSGLTEDDLKAYDAWSSDIKSALETNKSSYLGTSADEAELFSAEKTPDKYQTALSSISLTFAIQSTQIEEIRLCKVRVFCMIDSDKHYQDVEIIVYKYDGAWYADPSA